MSDYRDAKLAIQVDATILNKILSGWLATSFGADSARVVDAGLKGNGPDHHSTLTIYVDGNVEEIKEAIGDQLDVIISETNYEK